MKRLNFLKRAVITAFAVLAFFSCEEEPKTYIQVEDEAALTQTAFADNGGKSGVTFVTSGAWTSTITEGTAKSTKAGTQSWVSINPDHGNASGTYTMIISIEPNETGKDRSATITISCNSMNIGITVSQKGTEVSESDEGDEGDVGDEGDEGDVGDVGDEGDEGDEVDERDMLIAFYQSTNGDNWLRKDNWCSDMPVSEWYGIETWSDEASKNRVRTIELPNNNLTGSAIVTGFKGLFFMNILSGNKIESLTIDNCGNELPDEHNQNLHPSLKNHHPLFAHHYSLGQVNLKTLKISKSSGYINVGGNFSAESVIISDCNLSEIECTRFSSPSTTVGTLKVSNCTMSRFDAEDCIIGNIIIDDCTFLGERAISVGNKTSVNNCKGLQYIYSSRNCSDLIVSNTICNNIRCGN